MERLTIYVDGASRGNPGRAGAGVVVYADRKDVPLKKIRQYLGRMTNNVAEYLALIYGLQEGLICRAKYLTVYMDSELVVKQIEGSYRVKNEMLKTLFNLVKHLRQGFEEVKIKHINRERNREADKLANQAIDMR